MSAIIADGSRGGPLYPLANQLNHDLTHLSLDVLQDRAGLRGDEDVAGFGQIHSGTRACAPIRTFRTRCMAHHVNGLSACWRGAAEFW